MKYVDTLVKPRKCKIYSVRPGPENAAVVVIQEPHIQKCLFKVDGELHIVPLPMPFLYYFIGLNVYNWEMWGTVNLIASSLSRVNPFLVHLGVLPLPNTGQGGYTCTEGANMGINSDTQPHIIFNKEIQSKKYDLILQGSLAVIENFWLEPFSYYESLTAAHTMLHQWGMSPIKNTHHIELPVYQKWSKLRLSDLGDKKLRWLNCKTNTLPFVKAWQ